MRLYAPAIAGPTVLDWSQALSGVVSPPARMGERSRAAVAARTRRSWRARWRAEAKVPAHLRDSAVRGYPDEFYEVVARAYRSLSALSARPVGELAEANDVPVTTSDPPGIGASMSTPGAATKT